MNLDDRITASFDLPPGVPLDVVVCGGPMPSAEAWHETNAEAGEAGEAPDDREMGAGDAADEQLPESIAYADGEFWLAV